MYRMLFKNKNFVVCETKITKIYQIFFIVPLHKWISPQVYQLKITINTQTVSVCDFRIQDVFLSHFLNGLWKRLLNLGKIMFAKIKL